MTLDLAAIDKRIAELRADDAAMSDLPDYAQMYLATLGRRHVGDQATARHNLALAIRRVHDTPDLLTAVAFGIARTRNSLASTADILQQLWDEVARLTAAAERAVMIADEAFGLGPVEPIKKTLSRIERGIFDQHAAIERMRPVVDICVRICELDELCMARQSLDDVGANAAELEIERPVSERHAIVNAYRASKR